MRAIFGMLITTSCAAAAFIACTDSSSNAPPLDAGNAGLDASATDGATAEASTDAVAPKDAAVDHDAGDGSVLGCANAAFIQTTFAKCDASAVHVGQTADAPGVTCNDVCCTFGFSGCAYRAAQSGLTACDPPNPGDSGTCTDIFQTTWSSQCVCTP